MDKTKELTGTIVNANGKFISVLSNDGNMYHVEFDKKHLSRFKSTKFEVGQLLTVWVKNTVMGHDVVDVVVEEHEESNVIEHNFELKRASVG